MLHRIPQKQLDENIFFVNDDLNRIVDLNATTQEVSDHIADAGNLQGYHKSDNVIFDPGNSNLTSTDSQNVIDEFANKPLAKNTHEISSAVVTDQYYKILASDRMYVGATAEDPNQMVALYDIDGNELSVKVNDITSDQAGTISVIGNTWYDKPYIQLDAIPNQQIMIKYGTESNLASLPINALMREGVVVAEVDSDVIAAIADIKGTLWDISVDPANNMYSLNAAYVLLEQLKSIIADVKGNLWDTTVSIPNSMYDLTEIFNLITGLTGTSHVHKYNVIPVGVMDGINTTFTLPGVDQYVLGTLKVYMNGIKIQSSKITESSQTSFILNLYSEQLPDAAVADYLEIEYILG